MAAKSSDIRPIVALRSTAGTKYTYVTRKNRRNAPGRLRDAAKLPRDSAAARVRDRDQVDGRPRGRVGQAGLSSIRSRQATHDGRLPGTPTGHHHVKLVTAQWSRVGQTRDPAAI